MNAPGDRATSRGVQAGFTLIELMVVIVVIAILASLAYPSYLEHVRTARRSDCAASLVALAGALERHQTITGTYLGAAAGGANTGSPAVYAASCPVDGGNPTYDLSITDATASTFSVQAVPIGPQASDKCAILTLSSTGLKGTVGSSGGLTWEDCWR